ncbi:prepilin-type N-terminal cleavage/methylation domain-containing protein [Bacillus sp. FJAT-29953]|nr:prepilin-type N-terminal cleavage/methylation domain-containing protein [Bacillus sp. FJAT-29953]
MKEQKGFTLIELLAVIVILGIIAAIAIPAIGNVINKSDAKSDAQDGVQIINAAKMYMANHDGVSFTANKYEIPKTDLMEYLDHVKDKTVTFSVVVTKSTTSGNFSYALKGTHKANTDGDAAGGTPEQKLIDAAK